MKLYRPRQALLGLFLFGIGTGLMLYPDRLPDPLARFGTPVMIVPLPDGSTLNTFIGRHRRVTYQVMPDGWVRQVKLESVVESRRVAPLGP